MKCVVDGSKEIYVVYYTIRRSSLVVRGSGIDSKMVRFDAMVRENKVFKNGTDPVFDFAHI